MADPDKRVSLDPLDGETALRALLQVKPDDGEARSESQWPCPTCETLVPETGKRFSGDGVPKERTDCPACGTRLIRHAEGVDPSWKRENDP